MNRSYDWHPSSCLIDVELLHIERLAEQTGVVTGHTTGFVDLDQKLGGLHPGQFVVLAARPGMGKTALATNIAQNMSMLEGTAVGIFSMDLGAGQLMTRMLCAHALLGADRARTGSLETADWERLLDASEVLRKLPLFVDSTPRMRLGDLCARARRLKCENPGLALIVIDSLQLLRADDPTAGAEDICRSLADLARDLECTVLVVSQLNRDLEYRVEKRPLLSDLRDGAAIETWADLVLFVYRDEYYFEDSQDAGVAEVLIGRNRNGPLGTVRLAFQGQYLRFDNLLRDWTPRLFRSES